MLYATDSSTTVKKRLTAGGRAEALRLCPWGNATRGFTGAGLHGERDEGIGLYMLGAGYRGYIPALRRFNSPDSWSPFGRGGINAYGFCGGDPVNGRDPTGHTPVGALAKGVFESVFSQHEVMETLGKHLTLKDALALSVASKSMLANTKFVLDEKLFLHSAEKVADAIDPVNNLYDPLKHMYSLGSTIYKHFPEHAGAYKYLSGITPRQAKRRYLDMAFDPTPTTYQERSLPKLFARFEKGLYRNFPKARNGYVWLGGPAEGQSELAHQVEHFIFSDDVKKAIKNGKF